MSARITFRAVKLELRLRDVETRMPKLLESARFSGWLTDRCPEGRGATDLTYGITSGGWLFAFLFQLEEINHI